ncbi:hypothetical protein BS78_05G177000 [Paspalum vaginatum]|nr:hypothetical protein BS78_05G177000 [Paspalum vaginatum]
MLQGVVLARRRRVHYHGDAAAKPSAGAGDHHHSYAPAVAGPALEARIRLEEKLRGAALPSSRRSRLMRHSQQHQSRQQQDDRQHQQVQDQEQQAQQLAEPCRPSPPGDPASASTRRRRAELTRTPSKVDVCAVCLEEVRVTRLPCSHKYHSDCVLPWLAKQPDCPCCRALVPSATRSSILMP